MKPVVLIIGKPNVGKSTLFNRIIGEKKSIVLDFPGVTRDHVYGEARWNERAFTIVDTCGIFEQPRDIIEQQQKLAVLNSIKEANLVLFVVDSIHGLTTEDTHVAEFVRKSGIKVLLTANKVESFDKFEQYDQAQFYELGFGEPIPVSAEHNKNIFELMDGIVEALGDSFEEEEIVDEKDSRIRVALVGRPNVGKSSLFNSIIGIDRAVVSDIPGTTRDAIDHEVEIDGKKYLFIDTAGLRRKSTVEYGSIEMYSVLRTIRAIEKADVVVSLLDSTDGITNQDQKVAGLAENRGKGTVVAFNKWDLVNYGEKKKKEFLQYFEKEMYFVDYSPVVFTSAHKNWGIEELISAIDTAYESTRRKIPTSAINAALERYVMMNPPPIKHGKRIKFTFAVQEDIRPPVFIIYSNMPKDIPQSYQQGLRNMIRKYIDPFIGSPIFLKFRDSEEK